MRYRLALKSIYAGVFWLAFAFASPTRSHAQDMVPPAVPTEHSKHDRSHHWLCFRSHREVFPRTYSYQYDIWFNRPHHFKVVGPDGKKYWRTTVRGLPMGTPWSPW